jgi:NADH dehydrogenase
VKETNMSFENKLIMGGKKVVIVGAGFGGLQAAVRLEKNLRGFKDVSITLIDQHEYHLFAPNLFEVASSEEEFTSLRELRKNIALPFRDILKGRNINFIHGRAVSINQKDKSVVLEHQKVPYDYLILAAGSVTDYFGIEGAEANSLPLKNLVDAFRIRNQVEFLFQDQQMQMTKRQLTFMIAGAGYTAVEFAAELAKLVDILCWKYSYPKQKTRIIMVEAMQSVIPGLDERLSRDALRRLQDFDINVMLNQRIMEVKKGQVIFMHGEVAAFDALIWTTGIKARTITGTETLSLDRKQRIQVDEYLLASGTDHVFVLGDMACVMNKEKAAPVPPTAQDAEHEGLYLADALPYYLRNQKPPAYKPLSHGFIVNIGGKWAILKVGKWYVKGWTAYVVDKVAHFIYYKSLIGTPKAIKHVYQESELFGRND